ncbi:MAG: DUF5606 domain-containing protein [Prevotellaceae bacterium]|jgi:hypothetical protein|nr:DUF5606 domain-containing protein [Prevotellaceae bacterium]
MQTDLKKIISITGHSGLYRYLSQGRSGIIIESLKDGKRTVVPKATKISSLSEITIYTESDEDMPVKDVLLKIKEQSGGTSAPSHKSPPDELTAYFASVVPEYDKARVHTWHIVKIIEWYNLLLAHDMLDFENAEEAKAE